MTKPVFLSIQDAELLTRVFTIDEPELLEGIVGTVPTDWSKAVIEGEYDLRGQPRDAAKCAHKGRHRHRQGYVCIMPGGVRFMVGKVCGAKKHGADMRRMRRVFDAQKDRQFYLTRLSRGQAFLPGAMSCLRLTIKGDCFESFEKCRGLLRAFVGDKFALLSAAVSQNGGVLMRYETIRDYAEEERKKSNEPIYKHLETPLGVVQGASLIAPPSNPKVELEEAQMLVREVFHALFVPSDAMTTSELRSLSNKLDKAVKLVERARTTLKAIDEFFSAASLRVVAAGVGATVIERGLERDGRSITRPSAFVLPDFASIRDLSNALAGREQPAL